MTECVSPARAARCCSASSTSVCTGEALLARSPRPSPRWWRTASTCPRPDSSSRCLIATAGLGHAGLRRNIPAPCDHCADRRRGVPAPAGTSRPRSRTQRSAARRTGHRSRHPRPPALRQVVPPPTSPRPPRPGGSGAGAGTGNRRGRTRRARGSRRRSWSVRVTLESPCAAAVSRPRASLTSSMSMPVAWPSGPTRRAISRVTAPPPQPRSRQRMPGPMPRSANSCRVVGAQSRASTASRWNPRSPPAMTYFSMARI